MIAGIGFNFFCIGSASTPKFSKTVAPSKKREPFGAKITGQGILPSRPCIWKSQNPRSLVS